MGVDLPGLGDLTGNEAPQPTPEVRSPPKTSQTAGGGIDRILQDGSRESYESPAGLQYVRGSQHGHRLKHVMAHTVDQPDRPGQHGVFGVSTPEEVVALVDEAFQQALTGEDTSAKHERERTIYTVNLRRPIGVIGGESGNRRGRPEARHLRLVLEDRQVITAFPVRP